jgi:hypothetical protein
MAHPLGLDTLLFNRPQKPALTEASDVIHVPQPLTCEALAADLRACPLPSNNPPVSQVTPDNSPRYYGPQRSLSVAMVTHMTHTPINPAYVASLALATWQVDWSHPALQRLAVAIDVSRGRLLLNLSQDQMRQLVASGAQVEVTYTYGFSAAMGGGPYRRPLPSATAAPTWTATVDAALAQSSPPEQRYKSLSEAVTAWHNAASDLGLIRILSSAVCDEPNGVGITIPPQGALIIEAPQGQRACLQGNLTVQVAGGVSATAIAAPPERSLTLSGLLIQGQVRLKNDLSLVLTHSTLIPSPSQDSLSWQPDSGSDTGLNLQVLIAHSIVGWVCLPETARSLTVTDSIMTGCAGHTLGATPSVFGPPTTLTNTTVLGPMYVQAIPQALNVIFRQAVTTQRRQVGSLRFSYVPPDAATQSPRLFRCQPALALAEVSDAAEQTRLRTRVQPVFTSTVYGQPGYGQLSQLCPAEITQGGEGDSEMGAFNSLHQPRRQRNLHAALDEYLGVDFASGVFYVT